MRKALIVLALTLAALPVGAADICPADPPTVAEITPTLMTAAQFDQWLGNIQHVCQSDVTITNDWDFGGGTLQVPNGTSLPANCDVGDSFQKTDATSGQEWHLCESTDTWAAQGGGGSSTVSWAQVTLSADETISDDTATTLDWDTEVVDTDDYHEGVTNPSRLTVPSDGVYDVACTLSFLGGATTGRFSVLLYTNGGGTAVAAQRTDGQNTSTANPTVTANRVLSLSSGDYVECETRHVTGGTQDAQSGANTSRFTIVRLGD